MGNLKILPRWMLLFCLSGAATQPTLAAALISERARQGLARVYQQIEEAEYDQALDALQRMDLRLRHNAAEKALLLQAYGHVYASRQEYPEAISAFAEAVALNALPPAASRSIHYALAQLRLTTGDYPGAAASLDQWLDLEDSPSPEAHAFAGAVYSQAKRYPEAKRHLAEAIAQADPPSEQWYRQLVQAHYALAEYAEAARLLREMIERFPARRDHWLQLAGLYQELGEDREALAVLELGHLQGVLIEPSDQRTLARYLLYLGLPHRAAALLEAGLQAGQLSGSPDDWNLLVDTWVAAKEMDRALWTTERALQTVADPGLALRRIRLLADLERWPEVIEAAESALNQGGLRSLGAAHLLKGIAHAQLQQFDQAGASLKRAAGFADTESRANQWINYLAESRPQRPADSTGQI